MKRHFLTAVILLMALGFYELGFSKGVIGAFIIGGTLEMWFWVRTFRSFSPKSQ